MKVNRRGFLKSLALAAAGLLGWKLPARRTQSLEPVSRCTEVASRFHTGTCDTQGLGMLYSRNGCLSLSRVDEARKNLPRLGEPICYDSDCIRDLQNKMGRIARLSFEKSIVDDFNLAQPDPALKADLDVTPEAVRGYDATVTVAYGIPPSYPYVGKIWNVRFRRGWDAYKPLPGSLVKFHWWQPPVNNDHPLVEGLVGVGLPDEQGGLDWWHRRTDGSE